MASRYNTSDLDGLLAAKPQKKSSLSAYRQAYDNGQISRRTLGLLKEMNPEVETYNANLGKAKAVGSELYSAMSSANSALDGAQAAADRANADRKNTGLARAAQGAASYASKMNDNVGLVARKLTGGDTLYYTEADVSMGTPASAAYTDEVVPNQYTYDADGNQKAVTKRTYNVKDPARPKIDVSGDKLKGMAEKAAAMAKSDAKRLSPQKSPIEQIEEPSSDSAFAETGNTAISSLAKYRSARG